jgi:hypothetical protein
MDLERGRIDARELVAPKLGKVRTASRIHQFPLDLPCSDPLLFQAFSPARASLRSRSNDAALSSCAAGDGVTGLTLVEGVRMAESCLMLADNDDLFSSRF